MAELSILHICDFWRANDKDDSRLIREDLLATWVVSKEETDLFAFPAQILVETVLQKHAKDFAIDGQCDLTHSVEYNKHLSKILFAHMTPVSLLIIHCL